MRLGQALYWANRAKGEPIPLQGLAERAAHIIDGKLVPVALYPAENRLLELLVNRDVSREAVATQLSVLIEQSAAAYEPVYDE